MKRPGKKSSKPTKAKAAKSRAKPAKALRKSSAKVKSSDHSRDLTETHEKLIRAVLYDLPLESLDAFASKNLMVYGTTLAEKTLDLASFKEAMRLQREQSVGLDIAFNRIPVSTNISKDRTSAVVAEEIQITINGRSASAFTSLARLSATFSFTANHWEVIHIHVSRPGYDAEGSDSWHVGEWSSKVAQLETQVDERTAELLLKNRELEIEAALERVRASTMAMHHSDELAHVGTVIFAQLVALGLRLETITFTTNYRGNEFEVWMVAGGVAFPRQVIIPNFDHPYFNRAKDVYEKGEDSWSIVFDKATKDRFFKHVYEHAAELYPQGRIEFALATTGYSVSNVKVEDLWLGMARYNMEPFTEDENALFRRFKNVFAQAYTRFLDLKKAEEQAHEALIETALEKVRSQSLAMHKSEDIERVVQSMFERMKELGVSPDTLTIYIFNKASNDAIVWLASALQVLYKDPFIIPDNDARISRDIFGAWRQGTEVISGTYSNEEKDELFDYLFNHTNFSRIPEERRKFIRDNPYYTQSFAVVNNIGLQMLSYRKPMFSREENEILKRFVKVFEQAYIRFRDLLKAEGQAREASIEAALERVRSRSMAMHKSAELKDIIATVTEQLMHLGTKLDTASFNFVNEDGSIDEWMSTPAFTYPQLIHLPYLDNPVFKQISNVDERGLVVYSLKPNEKDAFLRHFFNHVEVQEDRKRLAFSTPGFAVSGIQLKQLYVAIQNYGGELYTKEENEVFLRFGKVFEQAYTRFLDLEKAEAQAEEAKIEGALEKVRSRSLAMHKSEEMSEVVNEVMMRLKELEVGVESTNILVYNEGSPDFEAWSSGSQAYAIKFHVPAFSVPHFEAIVDGIRNGESLVTGLYTFEEKNKWFTFLFENTEYAQIPTDRKKYILDSPLFGVSVGLSKNIGIQINSYHRPAFSSRENDILVRFARVFEQAYTRFLDLQKAEAQAREGQIQLALERLRARTMAMHHSSELGEAAALMFEQLKELGVKVWTCGFAICEKDNETVRKWMASPLSGELFDPIDVRYAADKIEQGMYDAWKNSVGLYEFVQEEEELRERYRQLRTPPFVNENVRRVMESGITLPTWQKNYAASFRHGYIQIIARESFDESNLFKRFAKVFEQTYTRFLDLKKAEAQAREAQIEAALERVRSSAMAMRSSDELAVLIGKVFSECTKLGIPLDRGIISIFDPDTGDSRWWLASPEATELPKSYLVKYHEYTPYLIYIQGWKERRVKWTYLLEGEMKKNWDAFVFVETELSLLPEPVKAGMRGFQSIYLNISFNNFGGITLSSPAPISDEDFDVILRFAKVFDLTYTRFNDLKQAEAQTREAQIEVSLERVRARTMAMHNSDDIGAATAVMLNELKKLGVQTMRCGILVIHENKTMEVWTSSSDREGEISRVAGSLDMTIHPMLLSAFYSWEKRDEVFQYKFEGEDLKDYYLTMSRSGTYKPNFKVEDLPPHDATLLFFKEGAVFSFSLFPPPAEELQILKRLTSVFALTFRRYQDLIRAEAQARESQIEAALERVRSKAMAMHSSDDLKWTIRMFYDQLQTLDLKTLRCGVSLISKETRIASLTAMNRLANGEVREVVADLALTGHPVLENVYDHYLSQTEYFPVLRGREIKAYYEFMNSQVSFEDISIADTQNGYYFFFPEGAIYAWLETVMTEEELKIFRRFTAVLSLTYKRYNDLRQAEANMREAKIEAALERVRAKAMAMHNSEDLSSAASMVFIELRNLGVMALRCGVVLLSKDTRQARTYSAIDENGTDSLALIGDFEMRGNSTMDAQYRSWVSKENLVIEISGPDLNDYYAVLNKVFLVPSPLESQGREKEFGYYFPFSEGLMYSWSETRYDEGQTSTLNRFKSILDLTFRRYMELQNAEANAMEASRQASLDRVRAEIASMRTTKDLERITPLIWRELNTLGVPFVRCGVFIMDEQHQRIQTYLSTPEGKAIAAFDLPYDSIGNLQGAVSSWRVHKTFVTHWLDNDFQAQADVLVKEGAIATREQYLSTIPKEGIHLHFLPFLQGMIYVGSMAPLTPDHMHVIQSVADAFSTAYARYEDFNQLERTKLQVENTLADLKQTQVQLVQSEKMASLGELTAGIAHEIQNPLNFVNNFAEVSKELLDEMKAELAAGNMKPAADLALDVIQNLEKINFHGKRADGIVKSMLQHSRKSSGQKELTDLNELCDEYLRLSYHGLRAKDKSFNAKFESDLDASLPKVSIVSQDIGRVVLNLINNAFYAVSEKKKLNLDGYEPTVTVSTRSVGSNVEICIKDNGVGIPDKVKDKIFQPFFTTKPAGQGTGLGLSLAYDIIKSHGGSMKVETRENEFTAFFIELPQ